MVSIIKKNHLQVFQDPGGAPQHRRVGYRPIVDARHVPGRPRKEAYALSTREDDNGFDSWQIWPRGPVKPFGKYSHHHPKSTNLQPHASTPLHARRTSSNVGEEMATSHTAKHYPTPSYPFQPTNDAQRSVTLRHNTRSAITPPRMTLLATSCIMTDPTNSNNHPRQSIDKLSTDEDVNDEDSPITHYIYHHAHCHPHI